MTQPAVAPQVGLEPPRSVLRALLRSPVAVVSGVVVLTVIGVGLLAPWIIANDPETAVLDLVNSPPGGAYLLGGDPSGRDIASRLIASINEMVLFAAISTGVAVVLGLSCGLFAGYFGRLAESVISWVADVIMSLPGILVLIAIFAAFGSSSTLVSAVVFGVLMSVGFFRLTRALVKTVKNELYVDAARVSGLSTIRILRRHILYVVRAPIIIQTAFAASSAIGVQAGLQFLGIGDPNVPSWGGMLQEAFLNLYIAPLPILWPGLALTIMISALVLFGSSFRDVLSGPRIKRTRPHRVSAKKRRLASSTATVRETPEADGPLLSVRDLSIGFTSARGGHTEVVRGVSLDIEAGEVVGLVGESGAGKSQTAFSILGLLPPGAVITSGSIKVAGREIVGLGEGGLAKIRGGVVGYVPQEPLSNLDPSFTIGHQLVYGIRAVTHMSRRHARDRVLDLLGQVGIADPVSMFRAYPHQISGGMAQRALIAGAVACDPLLLVADEPTTALDVTVQADILDLLRNLQRDRGMGVLIVTHNFGVVADLCDRVAVMHEGRIVEQGATREVFESPTHEHTISLLAAIITDSEVREDSRPPGGRVEQEAR